MILLSFGAPINYLRIISFYFVCDGLISVLFIVLVICIFMLYRFRFWPFGY